MQSPRRSNERKEDRGVSASLRSLRETCFTIAGSAKYSHALSQSFLLIYRDRCRYHIGGSFLFFARLPATHTNSYYPFQ